MLNLDPQAMYYSLIRNLLFNLEPEKSHNLTLKFLKCAEWLKLHKYFPPSPKVPCKVMGLDFPNPVGLAAGMDKNGEYISALAMLGFGFIEVGTVTPKAQAGNDQPRLFRLPEEQALINRMGFNNRGIDYLIQKIKASYYPGILGINIGKNFNTPIEQAIDDFLLGFRWVAGVASYVAINISSPNTVQLRSLQFGASLTNLLRALKQEQKIQAELSHKYTPIAVKISPDLTAEEIKLMAEIFLTEKIDAVIACNTTITRPGLAQNNLTKEQGGLSGKPLQELSLNVIQQFYDLLKDEIPIIGVGGIVSPQNASQMFIAGAKLIQLYTGLIYRGPGLIGDCINAYQNMLDK